MANWIEPIYDRTQADVNYAIERMEYFRRNGGITDGVDLKGCFNSTDIQRIENNVRYLCDRLVKLYYFCDIETIHSWTRDSIPITTQLTRVINNVAKLRSAYYTPTNSPTLPKTLLNYNEVNDVERSMYLLKLSIDSMERAFRECGTFECGEVY